MNALATPPRCAIQLPANRRGTTVFGMAGETDIAALSRAFEAHNTSVQASLTKSNERFVAIEKELEVMSTRNAALTVSGGAISDAAAQKELKALAVFARTGEIADIRALSVDSDPDGGYLSLPTVEQSIRKIARDISPLRTLASVITIGTGSYEALIDPTNPQADWVSERDARSETAGPSLKKISIPVNELSAMPKATQTLIDDRFVDLGQWLSGSISTAFALKEGTAFASGDGVGKPMGFLSYAAESGEDFARSRWDSYQYVAVGSTTPTDAQLADGIIAVSTKLRVPYRANATWLFSRSLALRIRQIKDSTGRYLWNQDGRLNGDIQETLCGFPIGYCEDMPAPGANACSIALADWRQAYTIVDRVGIRVLRDAFTSKPYVLFYTTKRVGGGSSGDFNSIKLLKWLAS